MDKQPKMSIKKWQIDKMTQATNALIKQFPFPTWTSIKVLINMKKSNQTTN